MQKLLWNEIKLDIEDAYSDNYGCDGEVRYYATATDAQDKKYNVTWVTTDAWDNSEKIFKLEQKINELKENDPDNENTKNWIEELHKEILELEQLPTCNVEDESNSCDWNNPKSVEVVEE